MTLVLEFGNLCLTQGYRDFSPMFSSTNFIVLKFAFRFQSILNYFCIGVKGHGLLGHHVEPREHWQTMLRAGPIPSSLLGLMSVVSTPPKK